MYGPRGLAPSNTLAQRMVYSAAGDMKYCLKIQFNIDGIRTLSPANEASTRASFNISFLSFRTRCCKNLPIKCITYICPSVSAQNSSSTDKWIIVKFDAREFVLLL
jgi:hypothetical protein